MSNGSKRQTLNPVGKSFIVDYRNSKYQGQVSEYDRLPHGMGMLLTIDYELVIGHWENGAVNGQCAIVYPNGSIFYGCVRQGRLVGVGIFQISGYRTVYCYNRDQEQNLVLIDNSLKHTVSVLKIDSKEIINLLSGNKNYSDQRYEQLYGEEDKFSKAISTLQSWPYASNDEKWELIAKISGETVKNEEKSYKQFIKLHFNSKITPKDKRLEIIQTIHYLQIRCKKAGIVVRIEEKGVDSNRLKLLGYFDSYEEQMDIFVKSRGGLQKETEECCEGHTLVYGSERPVQCRMNLLNYYRKSTNFINTFIALKCFSSIKRMYQTIDQMVETQLGMKDAQEQLQMAYDYQKGPQEFEEKAPNNHHTSSHMELQEIRNEVYNRISRKKQSSLEYKPSHRKSLNVSRKNHQGSQYNYQYKENDEYFEALAEKYKLEPFENKHKASTTSKKHIKDSHQKKYMKYAEETPSKYPKEYLKYTEQTPERSKHKKSTKYQLESPSSKYSVHQKSSQYEADRLKQNSATKRRHKFDLNLKNLKREDNDSHENQYQPYHHVPKQFYSPAFHNQSLGTLTHNYQQIENVLKHQKSARSKRKYHEYQPTTPTSKSPSRYNYLKSPRASPSGSPGRSRRQWR